MTLIVGVRCQNGIFVIADGATTIGAASRRTRKIAVIDETAVATAGTVGLGGQLRHQLKTTLARLRETEPHSRLDFITATRLAMWEVIHSETRIARDHCDLTGGHPLDLTSSETLIACYHQGDPLLVTYDELAAPTEVTEDMAITAIGSGSQFALAFLGFIRRLAWPERLPTLEEGRFAAMWTMRQVIRTVSGGVADPIQAVLLTPDAVTEFSRDELIDHDREGEELNRLIEKWHAERYRYGDAAGAEDLALLPPG